MPGTTSVKMAYFYILTANNFGIQEQATGYPCIGFSLQAQPSRSPEFYIKTI